MHVKIEKMKPEDWKQVSRIYIEGVNTGNGNFEPILPLWNKWNRDRVPGCSIVARKENIIVGWASLSLTSKLEAYNGVVEDSVYIAREYRRKGIGNLLLKELIELSEKKGIWTLQARIFSENTESIALHKKHNFRIVGTHERIGRLNGKWRDVAIMERRSKNVGN